jgi:hypothetical protein
MTHGRDEHARARPQNGSTRTRARPVHAHPLVHAPGAWRRGRAPHAQCALRKKGDPSWPAAQISGCCSRGVSKDMGSRATNARLSSSFLCLPPLKIFLKPHSLTPFQDCEHKAQPPSPPTCRVPPVPSHRHAHEAPLWVLCSAM